MKVFVIYDEYNFQTVGVVEAEFEAEALAIAEADLGSPLNHRFIAMEFQLIRKGETQGLGT